MPACSYNDYARLLLAMPGTAEELGERVGSSHTGTARLLSSLWKLGLCYPGGVRVVKQHANKTAVWFMGQGEKAEGLRVKPVNRPKAQHIAFASIWRALEEGGTARGVAAECGASHVSVYALLEVLKNTGMVHVMTWDKDALGRHVAVWKLGPGRDEKKPRAKRAGEKAREYRQRLAIRALTMFGAANDSRARVLEAA